MDCSMFYAAFYRLKYTLQSRICFEASANREFYAYVGFTFIFLRDVHEDILERTPIHVPVKTVINWRHGAFLKLKFKKRKTDVRNRMYVCNRTDVFRLHFVTFTPPRTSILLWKPCGIYEMSEFYSAIII